MRSEQLRPTLNIVHFTGTSSQAQNWPNRTLNSGDLTRKMGETLGSLADVVRHADALAVSLVLFEDSHQHKWMSEVRDLDRETVLACSAKMADAARILRSQNLYLRNNASYHQERAKTQLSVVGSPSCQASFRR
jgi:hypothetical protein